MRLIVDAEPTRVRKLLSTNASAPKSVLYALSDDESLWPGMALNHGLPAALYARIFRVVFSADMKNNQKQGDSIGMLTDEWCQKVLMNLVVNSKTPPWIIARLTRSTHLAVRRWANRHPNLPLTASR